MKKSHILIILILFAFEIFAQSKSKDQILYLKTDERNSKTLKFLKKQRSNYDLYFVKADNVSTKEFSKCSWQASFHEKKMMIFRDKLLSALTAMKNIDEYEYKDSEFHLRKRKNKLRIDFLNSVCENHHKTHYFQKSCNRKLNFVLYSDQIMEMYKKLDDNLNPYNVVVK